MHVINICIYPYACDSQEQEYEFRKVLFVIYKANNLMSPPDSEHIV